MHPSVLEAQSKSEAVVQLTVALRESNVPHLRWSQAPPCLGQGEAGSADINLFWEKDPFVVLETHSWKNDSFQKFGTISACVCLFCLLFFCLLVPKYF